jgi:hypothetical protein
MRASCAPVLVLIERSRADESGFAELLRTLQKALLIHTFGLSKAMERTGIEPVTSGLQNLLNERLRRDRSSAQTLNLLPLLRGPRRHLAAPSAALGTAALDQILEPIQIAAHSALVEAGG